MLDAVYVFTKGGVVLWMYQFVKVKGNPIDDLIKQVLLEERTGEQSATIGPYSFKWTLDNDSEFVAVAIYQGIVQAQYLNTLLELIRKEFISVLNGRGKEVVEPVDYDAKYKEHAARALKAMQDAKRPQMKSFADTKKGQDVIKAGGTVKHGRDENEEPVDSGKLKGPRPFQKKEKVAKEDGDAKKGKEGRVWGTTQKITAQNMKDLDMSAQVGDEADRDAAMRAQYLGSDEEGEPSDVDSLDSESDEPEDGKVSGLFKQLTSRVQNFTGNKTLASSDLRPILGTFQTQLMAKNVAQSVAGQLAESVETTLLGAKTEKFTSIGSTVKSALTSAMEKILTPKRSVDVLKDALDAKAKGKVYSVVFLGVNGVGKSTNLSKVAYYLKHKGGLNVMIAACDTFRAGAVEQLRTHSRCLDVHLFERGYGKDAAHIANEAIRFAGSNGYDVVLVDTAGRMQDNEPLMKSLAKLVAMNRPDLVLFVGEALVGNDSIDQLTKFNRALIDMSEDRKGIDGILLTKYDTVDDKVGAALSMVYLTGQPIVFVGCGQKYTQLRKLQVKEVVKALLS